MRQAPDDEELIRGFKKGDISAFDQLVLKYQDKVFNLCRHMLGDAHDADDAAQDIFIKAYRNLNHFKPDASFYTWLYRIAVNTCLDYRKRPFFGSIFKSSPQAEESFQEPASEAPSPDNLYEAKQLSLALRRSLAKLSPKLRAVIILKEVEGLSYEEIAEVLDVSTGTVKSRISRAREELRGLMKKVREQN